MAVNTLLATLYVPGFYELSQKGRVADATSVKCEV
jgi:hypothetical protein